MLAAVEVDMLLIQALVLLALEVLVAAALVQIQVAFREQQGL
jgi:hypothetical protein